MSLMLLPHRRVMRAGGVASQGGFGTAASDYDGTNDYMTRGANLTGISDGDAGTFSAWLVVEGGSGGNRKIMINNSTGGTAGIDISLNSANVFALSGRSTVDVQTLAFSSNTTYSVAATWLHVLMSWDASAGNAHLYVNGSDDIAVGATVLPGDLDYTEGNWAVGAVTTGTSRWNGCMSELFFHTTYLDITNAGNRAKFRDATTGRPVFLGVDGSTPLGVQPLIYDRFANGTNLGSGGNFTVTGALDACSSAP